MWFTLIYFIVIFRFSTVHCRLWLPSRVSKRNVESSYQHQTESIRHLLPEGFKSAPWQCAWHPWGDIKGSHVNQPSLLPTPDSSIKNNSETNLHTEIQSPKPWNKKINVPAQISETYFPFVPIFSLKSENSRWIWERSRPFPAISPPFQHLRLPVAPPAGPRLHGKRCCHFLVVNFNQSSGCNCKKYGSKLVN